VPPVSSAWKLVSAIAGKDDKKFDAVDAGTKAIPAFDAPRTSSDLDTPLVVGQDCKMRFQVSKRALQIGYFVRLSAFASPLRLRLDKASGEQTK
jgi:hypothetical protein